MAAYQQILPDLIAYQRELCAAGAVFPLPTVPASAHGLLAELPPPSSGRTGWPWDLEVPPRPADGNQLPRFTIAMPSYQQGRYLEEAIRSVLLQNYPNLEFVLMDGGSTDESTAIIAKYRPWLSFARSGRDRGQAHAVNLGLSLASGDVVGWLNSDDLYMPGALNEAADWWLRGAEFIYGDLVELDMSKRRLTYAPAAVVRSRYLRWGGLINQASAFWSARKNRPVWEEQWCALDYELWIRLVPGMKLGYTGSALAIARKHDLAKTYNPETRRRWDADAERNGLAHPDLYTDTLAHRCMAWEYAIVQRLVRNRRSRSNAANLATVRRRCNWIESGPT